MNHLGSNTYRDLLLLRFPPSLTPSRHLRPQRDMDLPPTRTLMRIVEGSAQVDRGIVPEGSEQLQTWFEQIEAERLRDDGASRM